MINIELNPVTRKKLLTFSHRRKRLILFRGVFLFIASLLTTMTAVAIVDRFLIISDNVRMVLSVAAYAFSAIVFWRSCLRFLVRRLNLRQLAGMFETRYMALKEELLSAVELSGIQEREVDSTEFRKMLQDQVAGDLEGTRISRLLPVGMIKKGILFLLAVLLVCAVLSLIPQLGYTKLMFRAIAPFANIGRVSEVTVRIHRPEDPDAIIPRGDPLPIVVEIEGPEVDDVVVEFYFPGDEAESKMRMQPLGNRRYSTSLVVEDASVRYRFLAGDAITRWYLTPTRPRPRVAKFHKEYHFPAYADTAPRPVTETDGDLRALAGSTAKLEIVVDQTISSGFLEVETEGRKRTVDCAVVDGNRLIGELPIRADGTYKVHLTARETGFVNRFSPRYEIDAMPDLVPSVEILRPEDDRLVQPEERVRFEGVAKDDFRLGEFTQRIRINRGRWNDRRLPIQKPAKATCAYNWDLLSLNVKPGDVVTTFLVAKDLKGNRAESAKLRLTIGSGKHHARRKERIERLRTRQDMLEKLSEAMEEMKEKGTRARNLVRDEKKKASEKKEALDAVKVKSAEVRRLAEETWKQLSRPPSGNTTPQERREQSLLAQAVSRLKNEPVKSADEEMADTRRQLAAGDREEAAASAEKGVRAMEEADRMVDRLKHANRDILRNEQATDLSDKLDSMAEAQKDYLDAAREENKDEGWKTFARRQQVAAREMEEAESTLQDMREGLSGKPESAVKGAERAMARGGKKLREELKKHPEDGRKLQNASQGAQRQSAAAAKRIASALDEFEEEALAAEKTLENMAGRPTEMLDELRERLKKMRQAEAAAEKLAAAGKTADDEQMKKLNREARRMEKEADRQRAAATEHFRDLADLAENAREQPAFAADRGRMADAIEATGLRPDEQAEGPAPEERLETLADAYETIDAGRRIDAVGEQLDDMADTERNIAARERKAKKSAADWQRLNDEIDRMAKEIDRSGMSDEAKKDLRDGVKELRGGEERAAVDTEMQQRRKGRKPTESVAGAMREMGDDAAAMAERAEPEVRRARELLREMAPSIAEQLRKLAPEAREAGEESRGLAESDEQMGDEEFRRKLDEAKKEHGEIGQRLDNTIDAMRRDANEQDLASQEGIERARDADDATAMMKRPLNEADEKLDEAAAETEPQAKRGATKQAGQEQENLARAMEKVADHYDNLDKGTPEETRQALRAAEEDMGLTPELDERYEKAERIADLLAEAGDDPQKLLEGLEEELQRSEEMRKALASIADDALSDAAESLDFAAEKEGDAKSTLEDVPGNMSGTEGFRKRAEQFREKVDRMAQSELPEASSRVGEADQQAEAAVDRATGQAMKASSNLGEMASPAQMAESLGEASQSMREAAQSLGEAAKQATGSASEQAKQMAPDLRNMQNKANQLAAEGQRLAAQARQMARQKPYAAMESAGVDQEMATGATEQGAADAARAARHAERLGNEEAGAIAQAAEGTEQLAGGEMAEAQEAIDRAAGSSEAIPPVEEAQAGAEARRDELNGLRGQSEPGAGPIDPAAMSLAQALDSADAAAQAQQGSQPQPGQGQPSPAMSQAAQAMQQAAGAARGNMSQPQERMPSTGSAMRGEAGLLRSGGEDIGETEARRLRRNREWGRLRMRRKGRYFEGRREGVAEEYRGMVAEYFKVLGKKEAENKR